MFERIRFCLPAGADADVQQMYGLDAFVCRGIMFAAVYQGDLVVRLGPETRDEALGLSGSTSWSPTAGDDDEYVIIPSAYVASDDMLRHWVGEAYEYAESLVSSDAIGPDDGDIGFSEPADSMFSVPDLPPPAPKPSAPKPSKQAAPKRAPAKMAKPAAKKAKPAAKLAKPAAKKTAKKAAKKKAVKKPVKKAAAKKKAKAKKAAKKKAPARKAMKKVKKKAAGKKAGKKKAAKKK